MTNRNRTRSTIAALLLLALASDLFGGVFTSALNGVGTVFVLGAAMALPLLLWAMVVGALSHRGPRRTR